MKSYTVNTVNEAWSKAAEIMPTDYEYDTYRSNRAGYGVYYSTADGVCAWVSDLGSRLEVNLPSGESVNVWIVEESTEAESDEQKDTEEAVEAVNSVKRLAVSAVYAPTVCQRVTVCIMGGRMAQNDDERRVYEALKREQAGMESEIITRYCECHGIAWGTISRCRAWHVDHSNGGGHFIVEGFVSARIGHEIEFLQQCADLLSAEYAKGIG